MSMDAGVPRRTGMRAGRLFAAGQAVWITVAVALISAFMCVISPAFRTYDNVFNDVRNFGFIAIMAMGQMLVIIIGGVDLSVGSVMGLTGIITGIVLQSGYSLAVGVAAGLGVALLCGLINGLAVAHLKLSPFIVTLGMLSIARSQALVLSNNKMIYQFGPDQKLFVAIGGGSLFGVPSVAVAMIVLGVGLALVLKYTPWGQHVYAVGGNEQAARLTGLPVEGIKISVYMVSSLTAGIAAVLMVGWLGAVTNALGIGYELRVIAATVIGGTDLMGGSGTAYGAIIGSALIEVVRNALLLAGVDPYWQGTFVGLVIACAVLLERLRRRRD
jgi:ribose transport system permease protein